MSQVSKNYYYALFGSSTRDHIHDVYIGERSENNIKCVVVHNDLGRKNRTTRHNCRKSLVKPRHWLYE